MKIASIVLILQIIFGKTYPSDVVDCSDIRRLQPNAPNGVYTISIGPLRKPVRVYCDMTTSGGSWAVFQRRKDGSVDFYRSWAEYAAGFGDLSGEFWLGNDNIAMMTNSKSYTLRVDIEGWDGRQYYAEYDGFKIGGASEEYKLALGPDFSPVGCREALACQIGQKFSTYDHDNDEDLHNNCAEFFHGAWWYKACMASNLNGEYNNTNRLGRGLYWGLQPSEGQSFESARFTEMKIRPAT